MAKANGKSITAKNDARRGRRLNELLAKHEAALREFAALDRGGADNKSIEDVLDTTWAIADQIMGADARTIEDVLVKARTLLGAWCVRDEFILTLEEYLTQMLADLERVMGGGRSAESAMHLARAEARFEKLNGLIRWPEMYKRCGLAPARDAA